MSSEKMVCIKRPGLRLEVSEQQIIEDSLYRFVGRPERARTAFASINRPLLGEYWKGQGGIYVGDMKARDGNPGYSVIAPIDDRVRGKKLKYGSQGEDESGAQCRFDGYANTVALRESKHSHPAAEWTADLEIEGHRDLHLPSMAELWLCFMNAGEHFEKVWHLSSTQYSPSNAWTLYFENGGTYGYVKRYEFAVRPVRRVIHSVI